MDGKKYLTEAIAYQSAVILANRSSKKETYVGLTETSFNKIYANHKSSFGNASNRTSTEFKNLNLCILN